MKHQEDAEDAPQSLFQSTELQQPASDVILQEKANETDEQIILWSI